MSGPPPEEVFAEARRRFPENALMSAEHVSYIRNMHYAFVEGWRHAQSVHETGERLGAAGHLRKLGWEYNSESDSIIRIGELPPVKAGALPSGCHRSHPHEDMSAECERLTEIARAQVNGNGDV